jgi:hypothetical protein
VPSEDGFTEWKLEGTKDSEVRESLVAFANTVVAKQMGVIRFGIANNGDQVGVGSTDALQKRVRKIATTQCYPPVLIQSRVEEIDGIDVVAVEVPASISGPHFAGVAFVRVGSENVKASADQFDKLILRRISKCAAILEFEHAVWTVRGRGQTVDGAARLSENDEEVIEAKIDRVDAHFVTVLKLASGRRISIDLPFITIGWDDSKNRPRLDVHRYPVA